ncbi:MAG: threonine ammonia-lyase [Gammaproteobacteria bacterium]|nr:threonine ammonia-lyase [Gammaproteobacteria bacterium]
MTVTFDAIAEARERIGDHVVRTPLLRSETLSATLGADLHLKFENLQFTASFKERGALNRLLLLDDAARSGGVIAMSAGNHAQALAYHGACLGIPVAIVMPRHTPNAKVEQTKVFGAEVFLHGDRFAETLTYTQGLAEDRGLFLVHPFEDDAVIAGQGTLGLEILEQAPDVDTVIVPVGGGGLLAGTSVAVRARSSDIALVGVQADRFRAAVDAFEGREPNRGPSGTIAEGIAVDGPGATAMDLLRRNVDRMVAVSESDIERAIFVLLEFEKTVTEGAGAAALAAVIADSSIAVGKTVLVLSGGNIDMMILSSVLQRGLVRSRRLVRIAVEIPDLPGALGELTQRLGALDSNIVDIVHQRAFGASTVRATLVELVLQMRGEEQVGAVVGALREAGYEVRLDQ